VALTGAPPPSTGPETPKRVRSGTASTARILIDTTNAIENAGEGLVGIYHSHTGSAAYPSQTDVNLAAYPDAVYVIVSLEDPQNPDVRGFWIRDGQIDEADLDVV